MNGGGQKVIESATLPFMSETPLRGMYTTQSGATNPENPLSTTEPSTPRVRQSIRRVRCTKPHMANTFRCNEAKMAGLLNVKEIRG